MDLEHKSENSVDDNVLINILVNNGDNEKMVR
jgi:hypothetical protein